MVGRGVDLVKPFVTSSEPGSKYFRIVASLGGGVSNEKIIMHRAEPITIGTTGMKPNMNNFPAGALSTKT